MCSRFVQCSSPSTLPLPASFPLPHSSPMFRFPHFPKTGNYSSTFIWCDRLFGTDKKYRAAYESDKRD